MTETSVIIRAGSVALEGDLATPVGASGIIVFAHGSGSSRQSPRNMQVAAYLRATGRFATLLFDLLTPAEDVDYRTRFDIALLAERLALATDWLGTRDDTRHLAPGYFGASTGAAAALVAASRRDDIAAIVSRGGRPDLAGSALEAVTAPTLLIVGGDDTQVIDLNREAMARMRSRVELTIVPGATHLFEEPGALDEVSRLARLWFEGHMLR